MSPPISYDHDADLPRLDKGKAKDTNSSTTPAPATTTAMASAMTTPTAMATAVAITDDDKDTYHGLDRTEVTRLLIQTLQDLGYGDSAAHLSASSQLSVDNSQIVDFRDGIIQGKWEFTVSQLDQLEFQPKTNRDYIVFLVRRQEFLEHLEADRVTEALKVLTRHITPLKIARLNEVHKLSSYLMYTSIDELRNDANWGGVIGGGNSRMELFDSLREFISPKLLIPNHRLATLLNQSKQYQLERVPYDLVSNPTDFTLYKDYTGPENILPFQLLSTNSSPGGAGSLSSITTPPSSVAQGHKDEVWYVAFSHNGKYLASSSKDGTIIIWEVKVYNDDNGHHHQPATFPFRILGHLEGHTAGVSKVEWSPQDDKLLTCSKDKTAKVWDRASMSCILTTDAHGHSVHTGLWLPNGQQFITASPGGDTEKNMILWNLQDNNDGKNNINNDKNNIIHNDSDNSNDDDVDNDDDGGRVRAKQVLGWSGLRVFDAIITPDGKNLVCICSAKRIHFFSLRHATDTKDDTINYKNNGKGDNSSGKNNSNSGGFVVNSIKLGDAYIGGNKIDSIVGTIDSRYVLVHVSPSQIQLWDIELRIKVQVYQRPKQGNNVLRCRAFGPRDNFIISGGADGEIYVWNRFNSRLVGKFPAHDGTVNCIDAKFYPETNLHLFASGGDDSRVKIWTLAD